MSNLIPTPRTDRNGRTVIRHMKPAASGASRKPLPKVDLAADTNKLIGYSDPEIASKFGLEGTDANHTEQLVNCVRLMRENNPKLTQFALQLIDAGSENGASKVQERISFVASNIAGLLLNKGKTPEELERDVREQWQDSAHITLARDWAIGAVKEELDDSLHATISDYDFIRRTIDFHTAFSGPFRVSEESTKPIYWRGLSMLVASDIRYLDGEEGINSAKELGHWLSAHEEPAAVIRLVRERKLHDVASLKELLNEGKNNIPLRDGLL